MGSTFSELFYFISISERDIEPEKGGEGEIAVAVKVFIYLFFNVNNFCK